MLFVTVAFGVGIDVPTVERVIYIGVPYTTFFRKRDERDETEIVQCLCSITIRMTQVRVKRHFNPLCGNMQQQSCRREVILRHFGASQPVLTCGRSCCDNCKQACKCLECSNNSED